MYYKNIHNSKKTVEMYLTLSLSKKIYKIDVREANLDEETPYVGWLTPDGNIDFIFPNRILLEVCFPYGTNPEIKLGRGKVIKVVIKEVE